MRLRLDVAYDGAAFSGWARQPGLRTVQGALEAALATVFTRWGEPPQLTVAGRTDAGCARHRAGRAPRPRRRAVGGAGTAAACDGRRCAARTARRARQARERDRRGGGRRRRHGGDGRAGRVRRPVLAALATLRVPRRGRRRRARSPSSRAHALVPGASRPGSDGARCADAAGAARLRGVLQAARGCDDHPDAPGVPLGPRAGRRAGGEPPGRCVLPLHGARDGGGDHRRRRGPVRAGAPRGTARGGGADQRVQGGAGKGADADRGRVPGGRELAARAEQTRARRSVDGTSGPARVSGSATVEG